MIVLYDLLALIAIALMAAGKRGDLFGLRPTGSTAGISHVRIVLTPQVQQLTLFINS
jgi:hypothetical protein